MIVGSYSGLLKIWDYEQRETVVSRSFDKGLMIQCCTVDPQGIYIGMDLFYFNCNFLLQKLC